MSTLLDNEALTCLGITMLITDYLFTIFGYQNIASDQKSTKTSSITTELKMIIY